uniref:8 kDa Amblyomma family member n=1 Tax=Rhipicephalus appendiculatus TaxID=34631 RepID=A0A131YBK0_RHIAP
MSERRVLASMLILVCAASLSASLRSRNSHSTAKCPNTYCMLNEDGRTSSDCSPPCQCVPLVGEGINTRQGNCTYPKSRV